MKISTRKTSLGSRRKSKVLAEGIGDQLSFGWSNYEDSGNEGIYSATILKDGVLHSVEFSHRELRRLVRYFNETEAGTRSKEHRSSAEIGALAHKFAEWKAARGAEIGTKTSRVWPSPENLQVALTRQQESYTIPPCGACNDTKWIARSARPGCRTHKRCPHCCSHNSGGWLLTDAYEGYVPGYNTYACADGCGTIVKQLKQ